MTRQSLHTSSTQQRQSGMRARIAALRFAAMQASMEGGLLGGILGEWYGKMPPPTASANVQVWGGLALGRITAGWTMVAALLATGALQAWDNLNFPLIMLLWLLVDLFWGALWRMAGGRNHLLSLRTGDGADGSAALFRLPYVRPRSPAAQLLSLDESNALPWLVRIALPSLVVALLVASALGLAAVVATLALGIVTAAGWTMRRSLHAPPVMFHAVVLVLLPWLLTIWQVGMRPESAEWGALLALALLWTLHAWGETHLHAWGANRFAFALIATAEVGMVIHLIVNKTPVWLPVLVVLFVPGWVRMLRGGTGHDLAQDPAPRQAQSFSALSVWWLAAMLVSAMAIGF